MMDDITPDLQEQESRVKVQPTGEQHLETEKYGWNLTKDMYVCEYKQDGQNMHIGLGRILN